MKAQQRGFTLVELMVVVCIIGVLASLVTFNVIAQQRRAEVERTRADLLTIDGAVQLYRLNEGEYTDSLDDVVAKRCLSRRPDGLRDAWGRPYVYEPGPGGHAYLIRSLGPDRSAGGGDDLEVAGDSIGE